jgi:RimJ/RimL family protein N-acetyltransferase
MAFPRDATQPQPVGHVGLKNRDGGQVGIGERGEISYWTAADARGRGIAPVAVRAVTDRAFCSFGAERLVHRRTHPPGQPRS